MTAQDKTTTLSTDSVHRVVDGASHAGLVEEKQYAAHVSQAVLEVVTSIRSNPPLTP
jgi:hypothetical protein